MKRLSSFLIIIFLITMISVFGQEWSGPRFNNRKKQADLFSSDLYGDYLLFGKEQTISLDLEGAKLVDVLKMLSRETGLNFISTEAVRERNLTTYLDDVPLKEAMDILFEVNNLAYEFYPEANMFVVKEMGKPSLELKTKVYILKYSRVVEHSMKNQVGKMASQKEGRSEKGGGWNTISEEASLTAAVKTILSENGRVVEDPRTNSLIVTDVPSQFVAIDKVIDELDKPVPQVLIEVEVLDVAKSSVDKIGAKWTDSAKPQLLELSEGLARKTSFPFWGHLADNTGHGRFAASTLTAFGADMTLDFFTMQKNTKILARPRILTPVNETAKINVSTEFYAQEKEESETGGTTYTYSKVEGLEYGTTLRVTPQVNMKTREITMQIAPRVGRESGEACPGSIECAPVDIKGITSMLRVKEGHTIVMGGLISREKIAEKSGLPFFKDLPLIGAFFRHKSVAPDRERELLIFLTPRIVMSENSLAKKRSSIDFLKREQYYPGRQKSVRSALDRYAISYRD
ncbi:MAG: hypothetical protein K9L71_00465 [Candidatus Omnitrophica bacterium]|nr:hypothetical protein [Candidatus Omnitrophota bacterium]